MGHCLGLNHEDSINPPPVMRTELPVGTVVRQLTPDDVAGRNSIYGAAQADSDGGGGGCSLRPGNPTDASSLLAALGNLLLPVMVLVIVRVWRQRRVIRTLRQLVDSWRTSRPGRWLPSRLSWKTS
jgi:hypothetical protein